MPKYDDFDLDMKKTAAKHEGPSTRISSNPSLIRSYRITGKPLISRFFSFSMLFICAFNRKIKGCFFA